MGNEHMNFIRSRMKEFGHDSFHAETIIKEVKAGEALSQIKAYNEHLFLVSDSIPNGVTILSDTYVLKGSEHYGSMDVPYEFRGHVIITSGNIPDFTLEFIRVSTE